MTANNENGNKRVRHVERGKKRLIAREMLKEAAKLNNNANENGQNYARHRMKQVHETRSERKPMNERNE